MDRNYTAVLVGVGNIGRALVENFCFEQYGFTLKAAFDINPELIGKEMHGIVVHDFSTLDNILAELQPDVAVLCVPRAMANDVANEICSVGVKAIWNFTNTELQIKDADPIIENIHFSDSLLALGYYIAENQDEAEARAAKTGKPAVLTEFAVYNLERNNHFDCSKAKNELGFVPRPYKETLHDLAVWLKQEGKIA